jgi:hypothetical protein
MSEPISTPAGDTPNPDTPTQAPADPATLLGSDPAAAPVVPEVAEGVDPAAPPEIKPEDVVPETYEDFKAPEGVTLDTEISDEFKVMAKELKLPQGKAQKVADLGVKMAARWQATQNEAIAKTVAGWADETRADRDLGGDKLDANLAVAKKALDAFGTPELKKMLNESGFGNNIEIIRLLHKAGLTLSEDTVVIGKGSGQTEVPMHDRMYGETTPSHK